MAALAATVPAWLPTAMAVVGGVTSIVGGMQAADAAKTTGARTKQAADFEAAQLDQNAGQAIAASQREAAEARRQSTLLKSRALALTGASGGAATDPTVVNLIGDIAGQGAYRAGVALYQGADKARTLGMNAETARLQGDIAVESGNNKASAYRTQGIAGALSGASSLFGKYGAGGPSSPAAMGTGAGDANLVLDAGTSPLMIG